MKESSIKKSNVTIQDIAESVNISASTVSRALNNHPKISQKTKEKVWEAAKQLGYLPNIPVYMQKKKNNIVIFLVDDLNNLASHTFILAAQEYLIEIGFQPLIKFMANNTLDGKFLETLKDIGVVGVISLLNDKQSKTKGFHGITGFKFPMVAIHKSSSGFPQVNVLPDIYNGAYLAANHLLKQGAKKIILIIGDTESSIYNDMQDGFKAAFIPNSKSRFTIIKKHLNKEALNYEFEQLIQEKIPFDGIITCNNFVASQLSTFLNSKNVKVPDDVMLISFGSETFINLISPGISTIEYSSENMGKTAAKQLVKIISNDPIENKLLIEPTKLIIRTSSMRILKP